MKVLIYLHGTVIMHKSGENKTPAERRKQVLDENDGSIADFANYIPIDKANEVLSEWKAGGVEIVYMSPHKNEADLNKDKQVLQRYNFPQGKVVHRSFFRGYRKIVKMELPDVIIEDDCESIGAMIKERYTFLPDTVVGLLKQKEMIYPCLQKKVKQKIKSIVVEEFSGIGTIKLI